MSTEKGEGRAGGICTPVCGNEPRRVRGPEKRLGADRRALEYAGYEHSLRDGGSGAGLCGRDKAGAFVVYPTSLDDGTEHVGGLARRGNKIEGSMVKCVEV